MPENTRAGVGGGDPVRQQLMQMFLADGMDLLGKNSKMVERELLSACPGKESEVSLVILALGKDIPQSLFALREDLLPSKVFKQLVDPLLGCWKIQWKDVKWAIETWAFVLRDHIAFDKLPFGSDDQDARTFRCFQDQEFPQPVLGPRRFDYHDRTLLAGGEPITRVIFSSDGRFAISVDASNVVRFTDLASGTEARSPFACPGAIQVVQVAPADRFLALAVDENVLVWNFDGGTAMRLQGHPQKVTAVAVSPDSSRILSGSLDGTVRLWDVATGRQLMVATVADRGARRIDPEDDNSIDEEVRIRAVGFYSDHELMSVDETCIRFWDPKSGMLTALTVVGGGYALAHPESYERCPTDVLSKSCRYFVYSDGGSTLQENWLNAGNACFGSKSEIRSLAISDDDQWILTGDEVGRVCLWQGWRPQRGVVAFLDSHRGPVNSVAISSDGHYALSGGEDGTVKLWKLPEDRGLDQPG